MAISLARGPYYIAVMVYMAFVALTSFLGNSLVTGFESDVFLALIVVSVTLAVLSGVYMATAKAGGDDEADTAVAGLPIGKAYYYVAILAICAWRGIIGYGLNHNTTGASSIYGILWLLSSIGLAVFTFANYRSYKAARTVTVISRPG